VTLAELMITCHQGQTNETRIEWYSFLGIALLKENERATCLDMQVSETGKRIGIGGKGLCDLYVAQETKWERCYPQHTGKKGEPTGRVSKSEEPAVQSELPTLFLTFSSAR
jgi:hypothetical protein